MAILAVGVESIAVGNPPHEVLRDVHFSCSPGTLTLILGANGSGKSVLLRAMLGLTSMTRGTITYSDAAIEGNHEQFHRHSGVVFQNPEHQLFGRTVRDDIAIALSSGTGAAPSASTLERVTAAAHALSVADLLDRPPAELSGGEQRRVAIAGALVADPRVVVLDEPTNELDYPSILALVGLIQNAKSNGAIIVATSHDPRDLWKYADQAVVLKDGSLVAVGPPSEVAGLVGPAIGLRPLFGATP